MAVLAGSGGDIYIATDAGTAFTAEACSVVSGTTYQINNTSKRQWDPTATFIVYDGGVAISSADYSLIWATGKIVLDAAPGGAVTVTGAYLATSQYAQATEWTLNMGYSLQPSAVFGATWEANTPTLGKGTATIKRFMNADGYFHANIGQVFLLELRVTSTAKYFCYGFADHSPDVPLSGLAAESTSFTLHGAVDFVSS